ncbi:hypothetical protein IMSAGC003_00269 [Lachnospiraceae bacterium]|jgi:uncharacterized membrane protein YczE|nr:hypothetical protein [Lachnospiraceae bacterium]MCX4270963.1 hypothetical protein [Acetatifactor sp.]GFH93741.1 hypothetical protein IMSAGC003_00269 [Lachnospiraceae bacterium]
MKMTCFARPPKFWTRLAMMITGVTVQGFGLSLLIRLALGTDPCSCLTQGVINYLPISFGTAQLLCHLVTFVFVLRFDMSYIGFGTIGNMVFLGYISDFFGWIWDSVLPQGFFASQPVRWGLLVPVLIVFILGASTYMTAGLGSSPYDAMPFIISHKCKKIPFKAIRMIWDISFMAAGFALGGDVGIVTLGVAFFLGPVISFMQKKLAVLLKQEAQAAA